MGWDKPANTPGIATVVIEWDDENQLNVKNLQIAAEGMSASASLSINQKLGHLNFVKIDNDLMNCRERLQ